MHDLPTKMQFDVDVRGTAVAQNLKKNKHHTHVKTRGWTLSSFNRCSISDSGGKAISRRSQAKQITAL